MNYKTLVGVDRYISTYKDIIKNIVNTLNSNIKKNNLFKIYKLGSK